MIFADPKEARIYPEIKSKVQFCNLSLVNSETGL